ncbi:DUF882 domain-containing protein [Anaeromyxobacter oryzae]|nr:DUF882 domain-containing protein [Anaeromyxobacter oryzae]
MANRLCDAARTTGRRTLLRAGAFSLLALALGPGRARAAAEEPRRLRMMSPHTGERVDIIYFEDGRDLPDALARLDFFLRDFRTGDVHRMDPGVLDIAWSLARSAGRSLGTFEIVSGYRSAATNALLHEASAGVAVHSLHLQGRAIDLRLEGVETAHLRDLALSLRRGGVGFYPESDFVHVDTGRVRRW